MPAEGDIVTKTSEIALRPRPSYGADDRVELARRHASDLTVSLLWNRGTGELAVSVQETDGDHFELTLASNERPLDVFYHPYAYAALRTFIEDVGAPVRAIDEAA
jgi:hypothetical protein